MELIKRTIITPVSDNLSPITISINKSEDGEYMVITSQNKGTETSIAYSYNLNTAKEWYADKITQTKEALNSIGIRFESKEYAD